MTEMPEERRTRLALEALLGMVMQHCAIDGRPGRYTHDFLSANEEAFDLLEQLGIIRDVGAEEYELTDSSPAADDWTRVEDALPERNRPVMIYTTFPSTFAAYYYRGSWREWPTRVDVNATVTHWQPMPPPPAD